jgi:acetyl-CoA carboxylase biotin carboxyl carrier protein
MTVVTAAGPGYSAPSTDQRQDARQPLEAVLLTPGVVDAVRALVEIMDKGGLSELDLVHGDLAVRLRSGGGQAVIPAEAVAAAPAHQAAEDSALPIVSVVPSVESSDYVVTSPMVGTFYSAPSPGTPPFVQVGDHVEAGQTVGIVEAMKIMNEIAAERSGVVTAILVENGQAVEYGSSLFRLDSQTGSAGRDARPAGIGGLE